MKKTTTALLFALAAGLTLSTAALAEPFNDRSPDYTTRVQPRTDVSYQPAAAASSHFNDRGEDYIVTAPVGSNKTTTEGMISQTGFNNHSQGWNS
jgi:hypothetical protein